MNRDPKKMPEQKQGLARTTKGPVGERRSTLRLSKGRLPAGGDEPREIISSVKTLKTPLAAISRGECSELPATLWSNLSVETTHLSRGSYSTGRNYGRESVVRGLPRRFSEQSKGSPSERIGLKCQRCQEEDAAFRVFTDAMDIDVCPSCAEEARQLEITTEDLPEKGQSSSFEKPHYEKQ